MPSIKKIFPLFLLIQILIVPPVNSEVYKWVDENGKTVYGDKPGSENAKQIQIKKTTESDSALIKNREQKRNKLLDVMEQEREEKITLKEKEKEEKIKQQEKCAELLSEEKRRAEIDKYEQYISKNC